MMQCICGVCFEATGESKPSINVTVKTGSLRIRTNLCEDCMAKAEDAKVVEMWIRQATPAEMEAAIEFSKGSGEWTRNEAPTLGEPQ